MPRITWRCGDSLKIMPKLAAGSVDAIVTDPPYGLKFMGKAWDHGVPGGAFWVEAIRVAKPGAHLVAFGGTRTYHRLACAIEDAGWEIRDCLMWLYGSGFPKSLDVSKAIDKAAGAERVVTGRRVYAGGHVQNSSENALAPPIGTFVRTQDRRDESAPVTEAARAWSGWGTALKPAYEPIILARKPLVGTVAANVLEHGVGVINVDRCRVSAAIIDDYGRSAANARGTVNAHDGFEGKSFKIRERDGEYASSLGRWPANLILNEEAAAMLDKQSGTLKSGTGAVKRATSKGSHGNALGTESRPEGTPMIEHRDSGGASRFFYVAKASRSERGKDNTHPTVKPLKLMRWLVRLVTPPGGLVLDPFCGSGSTGLAANAEGFDFIGIDLNPEYVASARERMEAVGESP